MTESTKIELRHRSIQQVNDITDLAAIFFPGNRNQQHAAARILMELKQAHAIVPNLGHLERLYRISRRTVERTRAKLARLGLIEHVSWMNSRYGGQQGWRLSERMSTALRQLADKIDEWRKNDRAERKQKDEMLVGLLGCQSSRPR